MPVLKRNVKDSVFTYLFQQPEYTLKLYHTLHPEDTEVTEADCKLVTLENVLAVGMYNDLGFLIRGKLILLVEAQSTFSVNITLRLLLYLAATYKEYVEEHKLDLYAARPLRVPRPELYVVYTGDRGDVPDVLTLSQLYDGAGSVDLSVKVLRSDGSGDILDQYVRFCRIADEERIKHGPTPAAIEAILSRCGEENILVPFLAQRTKEVHDIMITLFSEAQISELHDYNVAKEAREEGRREGLRDGLREGRYDEFLDTIKALHEAGQSVSFMEQITRRPRSEVIRGLNEMNLPIPV